MAFSPIDQRRQINFLDNKKEKPSEQSGAEYIVERSELSDREHRAENYIDLQSGPEVGSRRLEIKIDSALAIEKSPPGDFIAT
jgi:hypothetical protein